MLYLKAGLIAPYSAIIALNLLTIITLTLNKTTRLTPTINITLTLT
jgi:hypothetical protein